MTAVSVIGRLGLDMTSLWFVATHLKESRALRIGHHKMLLMAGSSTAVLVFIGMIGSTWLAETIFSDSALSGPLRWMLLSAVPFTLMNIYAETLRATERVGLASVLQGGLIPAVSLFAVWILHYFMNDILVAVFAYFMANLIAMFCGWRVWKKVRPELSADMDSSVENVLTSSLLKRSLPMAGIAATSLVMSLSDTFILGFFRSAQEVGIYSACLRLSILVSFILIAVNSILGPRFAVLYKTGQRSEMELYAQNGTLLMSVLSLPLLVLFVTFPAAVLSLFGDEFVHGSSTLMILAAGQFVNVSAGSVGLLLMMSGLQRTLQRINLFAMLVSVGLGFVLIPLYGLVGAALANAMGLVFLNVMALWVTIQRLNISTIPGINLAGRL